MVRKKSEIKVSASDALEFEAVKISTRRPRRRGLKYLAVIIFVFGAGAAGWEIYGAGIMAFIGNADKEVPLLRPEAGPVKVRPNNPGGLQVPYRDKLVYKRLSGDKKSVPRIERLLPPPELPIPLPNKEPELAISNQPKTAHIPSLSDVENVTPPEPAPTLEIVESLEKKIGPIVPGRSSGISRTLPSQVMDKKIARSIKPKKPDQEVQKQLPKMANRPLANKKSVKDTSSKTYQVQLAASRSSKGARAEWRRLRKKNSDLIGDLKLTIFRVDLGKKKGVFFRLRVGPLLSDREARKLCHALKNRRVGCLVVKPGT